MRTKGEIVNNAFSLIGISSLTRAVRPDDMMRGLHSLDNMMSELEEAKNIQLGYRFTEVPDSVTEHGVQREFWDMMSYNLAVRLTAVYEIPLNMEVAGRARSSLQSAYNATAKKRVFEYSNPGRMPIGSGNSRRLPFRRFYRDGLPPSSSDKFIRRGDVADFYEDYTAYLEPGETIDTYGIKADVGLVLVSSSNNSPRINYRLRGEPGTGGGLNRTVEVKITTSAGRVETRYPQFFLLAEIQIQEG